MAKNDDGLPLWLDIKTEYIDENLDKVIEYLYQGSMNPKGRDSFYAKTADLLSRRVSDLMEEMTAVMVCDEDNDCGNGALNATRLIGAHLLSCGDIEASLCRRAYFAMMSFLSRLVPENLSTGLVEKAMEYLIVKQEKKLPFGWDDIRTPQPQVLAHKIIHAAGSPSTDTEDDLCCANGTVIIEKGVLSVTSLNEDESRQKELVPSFGILDDKIRIMATKDEKVKKSDESNIEVLKQFTDSFINGQRQVRPPVLKRYSEGDSFEVVITGFGEDCINVESIDDRYETFTGTVRMEQPVFYYDISDLIRYCPVGDVLKVQLADSNNSLCSIIDELNNYLIEEVADADFGETVLAMFIDSFPDKKGDEKIIWWTEKGYPAYTFNTGGFQKDDFAYITIQNHGEGKYYGYINAQIKEKTDDSFDYEESRENFIANFSYGAHTPVEKTPQLLNRGCVKEMCRMLVGYQQHVAKPSERYRILCVARILAAFVGDEKDLSYLSFMADYLKNLILFATGEQEKMAGLVPDGLIADSPSVSRKVRTVDILRAFGNPERGDALNGFIEEETDTQLVKIAVLVQSCNRLSDVISRSMINVIKREIIKCLSIEAESETDFEEENGIYLGIESSRQEFKTSFFHAPANAKEQRQKVTIFKTVCGFLNSQVGGTLYIGVDDTGYVKGIDEDIAYMERTVPGNFHGIDGYIRHITDEAKKSFDVSILSRMEIEAMYDGRVVALNVKPYEFGVVELDGTAYLRLNNETIVMNDLSKRQLTNRRIERMRGDAKNICCIQDAISGKKMAIFHGYSSSSSGKKADRTVEPHSLDAVNNIVWCYDTDKGRNAVFRIDRISNVEVTKSPWKNESLHKKTHIDAFHMTGETPIHVSLQLDLMAKNLLCEEYPDAASSVSATDDDNKWIFDADVYSVNGIGRFYLGLAADIVIIDAPELVKYATEYAQKHIFTTQKNK